LQDLDRAVVVEVVVWEIGTTSCWFTYGTQLKVTGALLHLQDDTFQALDYSKKRIKNRRL
jgi:hypothetical protein